MWRNARRRSWRCKLSVATHFNNIAKTRTWTGVCPSLLDKNSNNRRKSWADSLPWQFRIRNNRTAANVAHVCGSRTVAGHQHTRMSCCRFSIMLSQLQKLTATLWTPVTSMTTNSLCALTGAEQALPAGCPSWTTSPRALSEHRTKKVPFHS
jgi:hypothetical protein